ncbi:MAG: MFS transporter [Hyphomonadaceae bacterium]
MRLLSDPVARLTLTMSCLFCGAGAALPFLPRWLEAERGLTGVEIGAVVSAAQLARIFMGPMIAAWADGLPDRRLPIRLLIIASLAAYAVFFQAHGFWPLFALSFVAATFNQAATPLVEGATLRASRTSPIPFGAARATGSIAFILGNVLGGVLLSGYGPGVVAIWLIASIGTAALSSFVLKPDPAPQTAAALGYRGRLRAGLALLRTPVFARIVFGAGIIQCAHAFYYSFSVLVWRAQGLSDAMTGVLWGFAVGVEVVFLFMLPQIEKRISVENLLLLGAAGAVLRWILLALLPPLWLLWPLQGLHALSFAATHVAALRLVMREAPDEVIGLAQTLYASLSGGLLIGAATILSGFLYDRIGAGGYWAMAMIALSGLFLVAPLRQR